ncbi:lecithin retinol acyltransferase-like [Paramacrobiotus metropolitanus]|uniref:lecithin retinol acyltransferase-like n=1 Tax=Paramacrobiotus metropolitanus TaxID=2943436 RepID=UPI0024457E36|nr:lecithin retinol acyltransferase-like [Paramacrobiotus metropolitanus]
MYRHRVVALVKSTFQPVSNLCTSSSRRVRVVVPASRCFPRMSSSESRHADEVHRRHSRDLLTDFVRPHDLHPLPGDLIEFNRDMYSHWGLYVGDGQVIHVRGGQPDSEISWTGKANVKLDDLQVVAGGSRVRINNQEPRAAHRNLQPLPMEKLVEDARKLVGTQVHYDLFRKNCEHYVTEWRYGEGWSNQVDQGVKDLRDLAVQATRENAPKVVNALQSYLNNRAENVRNRVNEEHQRLRNVLSNLLHNDHVRTLAEWPVQQTIANLAEKITQMLQNRVANNSASSDSSS